MSDNKSDFKYKVGDVVRIHGRKISSIASSSFRGKTAKITALASISLDVPYYRLDIETAGGVWEDEIELIENERKPDEDKDIEKIKQYIKETSQKAYIQ